MNWTKHSTFILKLYCKALPFALGFFMLFQSLIANPHEAEKLFSQKQYNQAVEQYKSAIEKDPENQILHYNAGNAAYKAGDYEQAQTYYQNSLKSDDVQTQQKILYNLGNTHFRLGQNKLNEQNLEETKEYWKQSIKDYESALEINPQDVQARKNLEVVKKKLEELENQKKQQDQNQENQENKDQEDQNEQKDSQDQKQGSDSSENNEQKNENQEQNSDQQEQNQQQQNSDNQQGEQSKDSQNQQKEDENGQEKTSGQQDSEDKKEEEGQQSQQQDPQDGKENEADKATPSGTPEGDKTEQQKEAERQAQQRRMLGKISREEALQLLEAINQESKQLPVGIPLKTHTENEHSRMKGRDW
jgi:Ca-activated chloride channel family protein